MTAEEVITKLNLAPHPEGGHYRQTWAADAAEGARPAGTAILFLLKAGQVSHWHKVDADEIWHFHAGAPLILRIAETPDGPAREVVLGPDLAKDQSPQLIVPADQW